MQRLPLYKASIGLSDNIDPLRGAYNTETGAVALAQGDDIIYDVTGAIKSRDRISLSVSGEYHSGFSCDTYGLCVCNGYLCVIEPDLTVRSLSVIIRGKKVAYARIFDGSYDTVFFSDGVIVGKVRNKVAMAWSVQPYVGVQSIQAQVTSFLQYVPVGHILHIFNGRMYIAVDNILYVSELYAYSWYDIKNCFIFESKISVVNSVYTGLIVSTQHEVIFMPGQGPEDFGRVSALNAGAIESSDCVITASDIGGQAKSTQVFFAVPNRGIYSIDESGAAINRTEVFINFPTAGISACFIDQVKQYIITLLQ